MKRITMFETYDGVKHQSVKEAKKYLEKIYGDKLLSIGRKLAHVNYTDVTNYIDENLSAFIELQKIKEDMILVAEDNEVEE